MQNKFLNRKESDVTITTFKLPLRSRDKSTESIENKLPILGSFFSVIPKPKPCAAYIYIQISQGSIHELNAQFIQLFSMLYLILQSDQFLYGVGVEKKVINSALSSCTKAPLSIFAYRCLSKREGGNLCLKLHSQIIAVSGTLFLIMVICCKIYVLHERKQMQALGVTLLSHWH